MTQALPHTEVFADSHIPSAATTPAIAVTAFPVAHAQATSATSTMYRPVASADPMQPATSASANPCELIRHQFRCHIQQLLMFADIRWKETNQIDKRRAARKFVQDVQQACGLLQHLRHTCPIISWLVLPVCTCYPDCS